MQADQNTTIKFRNNVRKHNLTFKIPQDIHPQLRNRKHKTSPNKPNHQHNINKS